PVQNGPELRPETFETRIGDRGKTVDLDQIDRSSGVLVGGKKGANQPHRRQYAKGAAPTDRLRRLGGDKGAVGTCLLLEPAADCDGVGVVAAGVPACPERQPSDDPRRVLVL